MVKTLFVLATATIIALLSCQDAPRPGDLFPIYFPGDTSNGQMSAIKSQTDWLTSASGMFHENDHNFLAILADTYTKEGELREILSIEFIPDTLGIFTIENTSDDPNYPRVKANYSTVASDGDVAEDLYSLDDSAADNHITLVKVDTANKVFEGFFTVSFNLTTPWRKSNPLNPDHVKFSNGYFKVKITN